jgi:tetratricopeptide (TPR) repeat protein
MQIRFSGAARVALLLVVAAVPVRAADQGTALRPAVGKPLQVAQELIKQQKFQDALTQIRKAEAAAPLSPEETELVAQLRGIAAEGAGDTQTATKSFETAIGSGRLTPADQQRLVQTVANLYYQAKDYPKAIEWAKRYQSSGGKDDAIGTLLVQAYYLSGNYADATGTLKHQIAAREQTGAVVAEPQLRLLADSELKQNDAEGYQAALESLVAAYPRSEYWALLIQHVQSRPDFPNRLALDVYRLSQTVGTLSSAGQYTDAAELAIAVGLPGEAKAVLDQGFADGVLGVGPEAGRQGRLRTMAGQESAADLRAISAGSTADDGIGLVNAGLDWFGHGQPQKAVLLIEQGLARGGLKHPDEARFHLGLAYYAAGQKDKSLQIFRSVQSGDAAPLARLWAIHCGYRPP